MPWLGMAKSGSERTKQWRAELVAQGYKQKALLLPPEALRDLKKLKERLDALKLEEPAWAGCPVTCAFARWAATGTFRWPAPSS